MLLSACGSFPQQLWAPSEPTVNIQTAQLALEHKQSQRLHTLPSFTALDAVGPFDIKIVADSQHSDVRFSGDEYLLEDIQVLLEDDGVLHIRMKNNTAATPVHRTQLTILSLIHI